MVGIASRSPSWGLRVRLAAVWVLMLMLAPLPGGAQPSVGGDVAAPEKGDLLEDRLVVGLDGKGPGLALSVSRLASSHGAAVARVDDRLGFAVVEGPAGRLEDLGRALAQLPGVVYVKPDAGVEAQLVPDDTRYEDQWAPSAMGLESAWESGLGSHDVEIAILDTGIRGTHEDLADNYCAAGWDYVNGDGDPSDDNGHGTHVAGTAAAVIANGVGVAGMGNSCLRVYKVLNQGGSGSFANVASAIGDATDAGVDIISMSLGAAFDPGPPFSTAIAQAWDAGVLLVAAAGNDGCGAVLYPAAYREVMAVGSLDPPGAARSGFSNCGREVEIAAGGSSILSTWHTGDAAYHTISGTSMATPHVAGVAGLVWSQIPGLTAAQMRCLLRESAVDLGGLGHDPEFGVGRVDAAAALALAAPGPGCEALFPPIVPPQLCETPGPDPDGYTCSGIPLNFDDVSPDGSLVPEADSGGPLEDDTMSQPLGLGFSFQFYGTMASQLYVCSNGFVAFSDVVCDWETIGPVRSTRVPNGVVAGLWADLNPGVAGSVHYATRFAGGLEVFVVQWTGVPYFATGDEETFQVKLFEDGCIEVHYAEVSGGNQRHHTGIENSAGTDGLWYNTGKAALTGHAVRFEPSWGCGVPVVNKPDLVVDHLSASPANPIVGDDVSFSVVVKNAGWTTASATQANVTIGGSVDLGSFAVPSLAPGETFAFSTGVWTSGPVGRHEVRAAVDVLSEEDEASEVNNDRVLMLPVRAVLPDPCVLPCLETFEGGAPVGFNFTGLWHVTDACGARSMPYYLGYHEDSSCTYDTGQANSGAAVLGLDLSAGPAWLRFWHRLEHEAPGLERFVVEATGDGGITWDVLRNYALDPSVPWSREELNLSAYAGGTVHVRWWVDTGDEKYNDYLGWLVDDVEAQLLPDLEVVSLSVPGFIAEGDTVVFEAQVRNAGPGPSEATHLDVNLDGQHRATLEVPGLAPGEAASLEGPPWVADESGLHGLVATVDRQDEVLEADEGNNLLAEVFEVVATDLGVAVAMGRPSYLPLESASGAVQAWRVFDGDPAINVTVTVTVSYRSGSDLADRLVARTECGTWRTDGRTDENGTLPFEVPRALLARCAAGPGVAEAPTLGRGAYDVSVVAHDGIYTQRAQTTYRVGWP